MNKEKKKKVNNLILSVFEKYEEDFTDAFARNGDTETAFEIGNILGVMAMDLASEVNALMEEDS